jgi:Rieske Fe-S protein
MDRRNFIKTGCALCLATSTGMISLLESCTPIPLYKTTTTDRKVLVPLTEFSKYNFLIVRPEDLSYDIAVIKISDSEFRSMVMLCTHAENPLQFNGNEFRCSLHGSTFNRLGKVQKGPAEKQLTNLKTKIQDNLLIVTLS